MAGSTRRATAVLALLLASSASLAGAMAPTLERCDAAWRIDATSYGASLCYVDAATATGEWDTTAARIAALHAQVPANDWLVLVAAYVATARGADDASARYREAIERFVRSGNERGELLARGSYSLLLSRLGEREAAAQEVARVATIGARTRDRELRLRAQTVEARHLVDTGTDLERAYQLLSAARQALRVDDPYRLRLQIGSDLASLAHWLGRYDEARGYYAQVERQARIAGDNESLALASVGVANAAYEAALEMPRRNARSRLLPLAEQAATAARAANSAHLEHSAVHLLAELHLVATPIAAQRHVARCRALAEQLDSNVARGECAWLAARAQATSAPAVADAQLRDALRWIADSGDAQRLSYAWRHWLRMRNAADDYAGGERALDAIEALRALQQHEGGRAAVLAAWSRDYYWLAGRLHARAASTTEPERAALLRARAFRVIERLRSRVLAERLNQRSLPALDPELRVARARALAEPPPIASPGALGQQPDAAQGLNPTNLRALLDDDEALLSFQLAPELDVAGEYGGGSWLVVLTRGGERVVALPDRVRITDLVALRSSSDANGEGAATARADVALYRALLAQGLARLPQQVRRLVVIADEPLQRVPFAALRPVTDAPPLGARHSIAFASSARLWAAARERGEPTLAPQAFVFAAPTNNAAGVARYRGAGLGELPEARREAQAIADRFGDISEVHLGADANETRVRAASERKAGVVHFAAHAVVDERIPERSAVVLSAQNQRGDGLLDAREIAALGWTDRLVVLSACSSAGGSSLRGEGVQSLARAFLAGGARTVIASLWRVRDDYARDFFAEFYRAFADGARADDALRSAQDALRQRGYPSAAWAAFQLYGDGRVRFAEPLPHTLPRAALLGGAGVVGTLLLLWWMRRRIASRAQVG